MKTSYHGKNGKFCKKASANTVTKGGERFKVVRQYRRIKGASGEERVGRHQRKVPSHEKVVSIAKRKVEATRSLMGRKFVSLSEMRLSKEQGKEAREQGKAHFTALSKKVGGGQPSIGVNPGKGLAYGTIMIGGYSVDVEFDWNMDKLRWKLYAPTSPGEDPEGSLMDSGIKTVPTGIDSVGAYIKRRVADHKKMAAKAKDRRRALGR